MAESATSPSAGDFTRPLCEPALGDVTRPIRCQPRDACPVCGKRGSVIYRNLLDRHFDVQGEWSVRKCAEPGCAMLWLDPIPVTEDLPRLYQSEAFPTHRGSDPKPNSILRTLYEAIISDYLAVRWGYQPRNPGPSHKILGALAWLDPFHRFYADRSVMFLPAKEGGRLLDVGCGSGEFLCRAQALGWHAEGVDFDPLAVETARSRGLVVHQGGLEQQHFAGDTYDAVILSHVIEHVPNFRALLAECHRVMKVNGRIVILTPNTASLAHQIFTKNWFSLEPPRHLQLFNLHNLSDIVRNAGFREVQAETGCHGAVFNFVAGPLIERRGRYDHQAPWPALTKIRATLWELAELVLIKVKPSAGEELRVMGRKI